MQCLEQSRCDRFRAIASTRCIETGQVFMHLADIRRKSEVLGHVAMILWRMIPIGDETDSKILPILKFPGFEDIFAYELDILRR